MGPVCPNCRAPVSGLRVFLTPAWGKWRCQNCGALLGIDLRARLIGGAVFGGAVVLIVLLAELGPTSGRLQKVLVTAVLVVATTILGFLAARVRLIERAGFRCRTCGYDLQGQNEPRCPECATPFDLAALRRFQESGQAPPQGRNQLSRGVILALALLLVGLVIFQGLGIYYYNRARPPTPTTAPTTIPASAPTTTEGGT